MIMIRCHLEAGKPTKINSQKANARTAKVVEDHIREHMVDPRGERENLHVLACLIYMSQP
jgi:hypothetical protein